MSSTPVIVQTPKVWSAVVNTGSSTTPVTILTGNTNGSKVISLSLQTNDTVTRLYTWGWGNSTVNTSVSTVTCAANSGFDGATPAVDLMTTSFWPAAPVDKDNQKYILLKPSDTIWVSVANAVTAAKTTYITAIGGDF